MLSRLTSKSFSLNSFPLSSYSTWSVKGPHPQQEHHSSRLEAREHPPLLQWLLQVDRLRLCQDHRAAWSGFYDGSVVMEGCRNAFKKWTQWKYQVMLDIYTNHSSFMFSVMFIWVYSKNKKSFWTYGSCIVLQFLPKDRLQLAHLAPRFSEAGHEDLHIVRHSGVHRPWGLVEQGPWEPRSGLLLRTALFGASFFYKMVFNPLFGDFFEWCLII